MEVIKDIRVRIIKGRLESDGNKEIDREFTVIRRVTIDNANNYFAILDNGDICLCVQSTNRLWLAFDVTYNSTKARKYQSEINKQLSFFES